MKSLLLLFLFFNTLYINPPAVQEGKIKAELVGIEYYSMNICKDTYPVYVRVLYSLNTDEPNSFKMKHSFPGDITAIVPITETDKKGNIVYGFCTTFEDVKHFSTVFISPEGNQSNAVDVTINVKEAKIISGTAPLTIKNE
jgi:hypothetical protein